jgi:hypothetical protein
MSDAAPGRYSDDERPRDCRFKISTAGRHELMRRLDVIERCINRCDVRFVDAIDTFADRLDDVRRKLDAIRPLDCCIDMICHGYKAEMYERRLKTGADGGLGF